LNTITTLSKTGGTYSLTTAEYNNGIIIVNGTLTSPLILVVPATSHPFILDNATTGAYSLTVKMTGGSAQVTVAQGNSNQLFCDGSTGVYSVSSVSGLQFNAVKAISSATNALTNLYQGAYTPMSNGGGTTYAVTLPQGSTMGVGGAVFLDAISGKWSVAPYSGDTADFGASFAMGPVDKAMFTWNGSSWRTTLYSNQASPVFSQSLTVPVAYITGRAVIGGVTDDGTTAVQATSGRFTSSLTVPTMTAGDNSLNAANTAYVVTAINNLIGGAPSALNTLKELADAINDDASYAASITTQLGTKASLSGANFTGAVTATALTSTTGVVNAYGYSGSNSKGVIYFTQDGTRYLYYDGSQYNLPGASLLINGSAAWTAATFNPANYAALAGAAAFGGAVTGTAATYALRATNGAGTGQTTIGLNAVGAATDAKNWEVIMGSDQSFGIRTINDAYSASNYALQVYRSGYAITTMRIMGSGGRTLIGTGTQVSDDGATNVQVGAGLRVQRTSSSGQAISLMPAPLNTVSGSNLSDNYITSYSATGNAKSLVLNATTDTADTASTAGNVSLMLQVMSTTALAVTSTRNVIIGSSTDDGSGNILQVRGGLGIIGNGKGITFPDGTVQNTAYCVTAPTVMSYTPANGVSTFSCQPYGVGLVQVFENGALITEYTATTGNSITLNTAANGRTQYTVVSGVLFQASNVLQPAVSVVNPTVGTTTLTLPVSTPVGYLWIFQGGAWLVPGQDFTFNGGTSVTLTAATTQSSDSFTLVMLQPVSFANTATQSNVQAAQLTFAADTGVANAYAVAYIPAVSTPTNGMQLSFFANVANTGASTLTCNGGTAYPIYGNGHAALTGGEIVANGFVEVTFSSVLGGWILMECTGGSQQIAKNLNFAGTGNRITGDLSNATVANRLLVQSSTVNGNSVLGIVPNGTSTTSAINVYGGSDLVNYSLGQMANYGTDLRFQAVQAGTGSYLPLTFYTSGAERMRVTPAGLVGINATGPSIAGTRLMVKATAAEWPAEIANTNTNGVAGGLLLMQVFQTNSQYVQFFYGAGTIVGSITTNGSSTAYGTTSDYRLKENVKPLQGALQRVMQAKPIRYNFKTDETKTQVDGFLAHELAEVIPEAVVGEKDKVTYRPVLREGHDPKDIHPHDVLDLEEHVEAQIVDHSKMVPLLTAALQEANVEIEQLKKDRDILRKQMDEMMQQMKLLMQKH
jgi:hypothetical protein